MSLPVVHTVFSNLQLFLVDFINYANSFFQFRYVLLSLTIYSDYKLAVFYIHTYNILKDSRSIAFNLNSLRTQAFYQILPWNWSAQLNNSVGLLRYRITRTGKSIKQTSKRNQICKLLDVVSPSSPLKFRFNKFLLHFNVYDVVLSCF